MFSKDIRHPQHEKPWDLPSQGEENTRGLCCMDEGQGSGTHQVAAQLDYNAVPAMRLNPVSPLTAEIHHSFPSNEYTMLGDFEMRNHVPCFDDSLFTSYQPNFSSSVYRSMAVEPCLQGSLHVDGQDELASPKLFFLIVESNFGCENHHHCSNSS